MNKTYAYLLALFLLVGAVSAAPYLTVVYGTVTVSGVPQANVPVTVSCIHGNITSTSARSTSASGMFAASFLASSCTVGDTTVATFNSVDYFSSVSWFSTRCPVYTSGITINIQ